MPAGDATRNSSKSEKVNKTVSGTSNTNSLGTDSSGSQSTSSTTRSVVGAKGHEPAARNSAANIDNLDRGVKVQTSSASKLSYDRGMYCVLIMIM